MAIFTDFARVTDRVTLSADGGATPAAERTVLQSRPVPSQRVSPTMPHHICLRLVGAWIGALGLLLAVVLVLRGTL